MPTLTQSDKYVSSPDGESNPPETGELEQDQIDRERQRRKRVKARVEDLGLETFVVYERAHASEDVDRHSTCDGNV